MWLEVRVAAPLLTGLIHVGTQRMPFKRPAVFLTSGTYYKDVFPLRKIIKLYASVIRYKTCRSTMESFFKDMIELHQFSGFQIPLLKP